MLKVSAGTYVREKALQYLDLGPKVSIKQNGLPDFSPFCEKNGRSRTFMKLTGFSGAPMRWNNNPALVMTNDNGRATIKTSRSSVPRSYTWQHHEITGIMMLVHESVNHGKDPIPHFGGVFYWEIAHGRSYRFQ